MREYDVAVIGAGVCGAAIAYRLSAYRLRTVLLEKEADVSFGTSKANSGIIHGGFHHPASTLKARLELAGAPMFDALARELDFPFERCGIVVAAFNEEELRGVERLYAQGRANGAVGLESCSRERILELEPKLHEDAVGGMYAPAGGIVEPYRFVFALAEAAVRGGAELRTGFKLERAERRGDAWVLHPALGEELGARFAVNAAGLFADEVSRAFGAEDFDIGARKGEYYLLDRMTRARPKRVVFPVPTRVSKGMLVIPTVERTVLIGPTATEAASKEDLSTDQASLDAVLDSARRLVPSVSANDVISSFAGLRPALKRWGEDPSRAPLKDDFYVALSAKAPALVQVAGIQSPGLTASPAIAELAKELLERAGLELAEKAEAPPPAPPRRRMRESGLKESDALIASDPAYGNIVCRCEKVSEAEIVEAIRLGHTTLDGIKFFTRAQMGRCQGGFCAYKIVKILMRETGLSWEEVTKRGPGSRVLGGEL